MISHFKQLGKDCSIIQKLIIICALLIFFLIMPFRWYTSFFGSVDVHIIDGDFFGNARTLNGIRMMLAIKAVSEFLLLSYIFFGMYLSYLLFPKKD